MFAVIFEVQPKPGRVQDYLDIAARLRPELEKIDGFLSIERFQSLTDDKKLLSLSFWRDEAAVKAWRNVEHHREAQQAGRGGVLRDYRLRVASVLRDYGMNERDEALNDLQSWVASGKLKVQEDVINGLENTPKALIGLLAGENRGKRMVKV